MKRKIRRNGKNIVLPLLLALALVLTTGCGSSDSQTETVPEWALYDPYNYEPGDFYSEGGYDAAKEAIVSDLPKIYCDAQGIVLKPEEYKSVLTISGETYDFENAKILIAVTGRGTGDGEGEVAANTTGRIDTERTWLDMLFEIPVVDKDRTMKFIVHCPNIVRTEDGDYIGSTINGNPASYSFSSIAFEDDIESNEPYIVNDENIKELVDYGIMEADEEDSQIENLCDVAREYEEERLEAYLLAHNSENASYFSTNSGYTSSPSSSYVSSFNKDAVIKDLESLAESYGFKIGEKEEIPEKEKKMKKAGWTKYTFSYLSTDKDDEVQQKMRETVRDMYIALKTGRVVFDIEYENVGEDVIQYNVYFFVNPNPDKAEE